MSLLVPSTTHVFLARRIRSCHLLARTRLFVSLHYFHYVFPPIFFLRGRRLYRVALSFVRADFFGKFICLNLTFLTHT